jgi:2-polyprenyl-3-methyl-5-hydroxy-6-metoxy-1,4-benzoquinol methylase
MSDANPLFLVAGLLAQARRKIAVRMEGTTAAAPNLVVTEDKGTHANHPFFKYYGMLSHQQNMLQDHIRTTAYHDAIVGNPSDFAGKVVLDVGTGSGILAYFAVKAGAR